MTHRLSKSRFVTGLQCHRQLWWRVHDPRAPDLVPSAALQARFDMGRRVGDRARQEFPAATLIELDPRRPEEAVANTREALARGDSKILEASFIEDDVFVAIDALCKEDDGWAITEVKASTRVKRQYVPDVAVQAHVVESAGLPVARTEVMHLNNRHRHPDQGTLFTRTDITADVAELRDGIADEVRAQITVLEGPLPEVEPGEHCTSPYECPFLERCMGSAPRHPIRDLYRISSRRRRQLHEQGVETIGEIPAEFPLNDIQRRQRTAVIRDEMIIEPGLDRELAQYQYPIAMLDFETINPALPVWDRCSPFGKVPVQFSVHTIAKDGTVSHQAYLAEGEGDPRPAVAEALAAALDGAQTILVWNASFEKGCLSILAAAAPQHAAALHEARNKVGDLLPVVRNGLYHPDFRGSFSIKSVVPALLPHMAYDDLEVSDGETAASLLETLLCRPQQLPAETISTTREQLLAYCAHDTEVMVALLQLLHEIDR